MFPKLEILKISTEDDILQYKKFLDKIDPYNPYYKYELLDVKLQGANSLMYFVYWNGEEAPIILMPFYLKQIIIKEEFTGYFDVSSPWGYTGPLLNIEKNEKMLPEFWSDVDDWYVNNKVITEFIRFNFGGNHIFYSGNAIHTLYNVRGVIQEKEVLWNNFKRSVRKNYQNALKNDLTYKIYHRSIELDQIQEFYAIYISTMDRHEASDTFYHSLDYFSNFILANSGHCALATVYKNDLAISTELLLLSNNTMFSFLGGTFSDYFHLRPNDLLKIETLNWAREMGLSYYVIGGGLAKDDSLYQYKKKFFPIDEDLSFYTGRKVLNKKTYMELNKLASQSIGVNAETIDISTGYFPKYRAPV